MAEKITDGILERTQGILNKELAKRGSTTGVFVNKRYGYTAIDSATIDESGNLVGDYGRGTVKTALTKREAYTILSSALAILDFVPLPEKQNS